MSMYNYSDADTERYNDFEFPDFDDAEPVCVCPEYAATQHVTFCSACNEYTDIVALKMAGDWDESEMMPARKPAAHAEFGVYAFAEVA